MSNCSDNANYLYYMVEMYRAQIAPMHFGIEMAKEWCESEELKDNDYAKIARAYLTLAERMTRKYEKPAFNITKCVVDQKTYEIEERTILKKPFCHLKHFAKLGFDKEMPKLLMVAPMAGHHATLLRETIQSLLPHTDIYVTDWLEANFVPQEAGRFDMDDFIDYVIEFIKFLGPNVHLMAVCQPTVPVLAAVAIISENDAAIIPNSMILIGGPIDARKNPTLVGQFALSKSLEWFCKMVTMNVPPNYLGHGRRVYPGFLQLAGFISLNLPRHIESHLDLLQNLLDEKYDAAERTIKFYDEYLAGMDMTAEFYLQTIEEVFQEFALAKGELMSKERKVNLKSITKCALLGIEGEQDDIAAVGQTKAALQLCSNIPSAMKKYHLQEGAGHYGVFSGSKFKNFIVPVIKDFVYAHDKSSTAAKSVKKR